MTHGSSGPSGIGSAGPWFPTVDHAASGAADVVGDTGGWIFGGLGDVVTGTTDTAAQAAGSFLGPVADTFLKFAALILGAAVIIKVFA